jgi:cyclase
MQMRPRIIPCLLLKGAGLYKTVRFRDPTYIGDPINTVRIFNDKGADEILLLDISASVEGRGPNFDKISEIVGECFMPLAYGGGITSLEQARRVLACGAEKIVLNSAAVENPRLIGEIAEVIGSQSVVVSIDVKKSLLGRQQISWCSGSKTRSILPAEWAREVAALGAGEIIINSVDHDGTMKGYDIKLVAAVAGAVDVPGIACGGAGSVDDFVAALRAGATAAAAGSFFVFQGRHRAVLISYPGEKEIQERLAHV